MEVGLGKWRRISRRELPGSKQHVRVACIKQTAESANHYRVFLSFDQTRYGLPSVVAQDDSGTVQTCQMLLARAKEEPLQLGSETWTAAMSNGSATSV